MLVHVQVSLSFPPDVHCQLEQILYDELDREVMLSSGSSSDWSDGGGSDNEGGSDDAFDDDDFGGGKLIVHSYAPCTR